MAAADTAKLLASLELQDKGFTSGLKKASGSLDKFSVKTAALGTALGVGLERLAERGIGAIASAVGGGIDSLTQLESAVGAADAAISQVGLTGKVTGKQIADWANEIEASVGAAFDDKKIVAASTTLLRFGKVTASNLRPALVVMTDLATKTGDIDSAAALLAKALADPAKAAGKLARAGVILTKADQDQIKAMIKVGDTAGAQALLLDKLSLATKGAALASQGPAARASAQLHDAFEDVQRALAEGLLPVIEETRTKLTVFLKDPATISRIREFGRTLATAFQNIVAFAEKIPWASIGEGLRVAADWAGKLIGVFSALPPEAQATLIALAGLNKLSGGAVGGIVSELGKGLIKGVLGITAGVVNVKGAVVNGGGGAGVVEKAAAGLGLAGIATVALAAASIAGIGAAFIFAINQKPDPTNRGGERGGRGAAFGPLGSHGTRGDKTITTLTGKAADDLALATRLAKDAAKAADVREGNRIARQTGQTTTSKIDAAKVETSRKIDTTTSAVDRSQVAIVAAIQALASAFHITISAADITKAQKQQQATRPPTVLNRGGAPIAT